MASNRVNRIAFSTSALTPHGSSVFESALIPVREWLRRQALEFNLEPLSWNEPLQQRKSNVASLITLAHKGSLSFAFAHADQHDEAISWHVLAAITSHDGFAQVDVEVAAEGAKPPVIPPLGMPGFMVGIVDEVGLIDCRRPLSVAPIPVTPDNAGVFADFLMDQTRKLPVVAFSQPLPLANDEVERISRRLAGAAHIALIEPDASFVVSDRIGREFSVYRGAVRVYTPNLPRDPYRIKLYFPATIQKYNAEGRGNGPFGRIRFGDVLVRAALDRRMWPTPAEVQVGVEPASAKMPPILESIAATASTVVQQAAQPELVAAVELSDAMTAIVEEAKRVESSPESVVADTAGLPDAERIASLEKQIEEMRIALDNVQAERDAFETAATKNEEEWFNAQAELERLQALDRPLTTAGVTEADASVLKSMQDSYLAVRSMIERTTASEAAGSQMRLEMDELRKELGRQRMLIESLHRRGEAVDDEQLKRPDQYREVDAVEQYLRKRHGEKIMLHPNAKGTLAEGRFEDNQRLLDMLDLLGTMHYAMKTADGDGNDAYNAFHAEKDRLHLKYSRALSETSVGTHGHHYEVTWDGEKVDVREIWHIRCQGTTYEERRMAALYFFWDDARRATVVTAGPEKLPTPADYT